MAALTTLAAIAAIVGEGARMVGQNQANQDAKGRAGQALRDLGNAPQPPNLGRQTALARATATAAGDDLRSRAAAAPGRRSTLLTGPQGAAPAAAAPVRKTLLGL